MPKAMYLPWTSSEEDNLPGWLSEYSHLSWEEKSKEYRRQFGHRRSPESLRGKQNQLQRGIRRRRLISQRFSTTRQTATRQARLRRRRHLLDIPEAPIFSVRGPGHESMQPRRRFLMEESRREDRDSREPLVQTNHTMSKEGLTFNQSVRVGETCFDGRRKNHEPFRRNLERS
ncbi:hypothetical protein N7492_008499 [Penicillium capsulatum]|uniref:Uncharacterized protein n=1 Tax=Penicillium capsulatum TaxID=69766 RepID=A0A9W9LFZ4_9EURO|nr:hypothetical protein N7492_008466 [Penicillium capsulatum]KAJ5155696.1 hypothetical protein N7492_008499 [Penicillium capsulatum]KAJ6105867.1 hypothetical protein N7512_009384 [Penicillium capsulatum]KAJ6105901.1 hypothetical protein N7512_009418 [Penicillium capsulatum]